MKFGITVFPGSNCDADCYYVLKDVMKYEVEYIWHRDTDLKGCDVIILPGGFSYGDYLRTGAIARFSPVMSRVVDFAREGGLIIGICNGFQILLEAGLLPGAMLRNRSLRFVCTGVHLRVKRNDTPFSGFFAQNEIISLPVAHGEGNYFCDPVTLAEMDRAGQILFTYCGPGGEEGPEYNPNGSLAHIAGITNKEGNVLGLMPHPERAAEDLLGGRDGYKLFASIGDYFSRSGKGEA